MRFGRLILLCNLGMMCVALGTTLIPLFQTTFSAQFGGLDEERMGRLPALLSAGFITGILLAGPLADGRGTRFFVVAGTGLTCLGLAAFALAESYSALLFAAALTGFATGILDMILSPIVAAIRAERRVAALNQLHAFYCVGAVAIVAIGSLALKAGASWRWVFLVLACFPGVLALGFARVAIPPLTAATGSRTGILRLLRIPRFHVALLMIALVGATEEGMAQWLPAYSERVLGFDRSVSGLALAGFAVAMAAGRFLGSHSADRIGAYRLIALAGMGCGSLYLVGSHGSNPTLALGACVMVGLACSVLWPTNLGLTADRFPYGGASLFALLAAAGNAGCLAMPWLEGMVAERYGLETALRIGSIAPFLLVAVVIGVKVYDRRAPRRVPL
jgi:fucose permease